MIIRLNRQLNKHAFDVDACTKKIQLCLLVFTDFSNKWQKPDDSWEMKQLCGHIGTVRHCQHLQRLNHCIHRQHRQTQSINQTNQSCIFRVVQLIHWRWGIVYRESMIISRNEAWNRNVLNADGRLTETGIDHNSTTLLSGHIQVCIEFPNFPSHSLFAGLFSRSLSISLTFPCFPGCS